MIRISQLKMPLGHTRKDLLLKAAKELRIQPEMIKEVELIKQSVDARKKPEIHYSYIVDIALKSGGRKEEERIVKKKKDRNITVHEEKPYSLPECGNEPLKYPPVIIGMGPAGLFCGLALARKGYRPILLERGEDVDTRTERVAKFWKTGELNPSSNVQFGEGGAGTFSDGKLNTLVKDTFGRNREVLRILTEFGADPSICYANKPHIGTDVLSHIVKSIRKEIESLGGQVRFLSQVTDFEITEGKLTAVTVNNTERIPVQAAVAAIGHSARDTFETLYGKQVSMEAKPFAVGFRIQHPQTMINESQYGMAECKELGPASYKLTAQTSYGRGVYSFCMCPGGYVVNASSEEKRLAVNGMSYHDRAGENANSAVIVTVTPDDFGSDHPLAGISFQRSLEEKAYQAGQGKVPVQRFGDFKENQITTAYGKVHSCIKGASVFGNVRAIFPTEIAQSLEDGITAMDHKIHGFADDDALLSGVESRTSSPVRIERDENFVCASCDWIYPCGEGAGYAGGITSAAMDGMKVAEAIIQKYKS